SRSAVTRAWIASPSALSVGRNSAGMRGPGVPRLRAASRNCAADSCFGLAIGVLKKFELIPDGPDSTSRIDSAQAVGAVLSKPRSCVYSAAADLNVNARRAPWLRRSDD